MVQRNVARFLINGYQGKPSINDMLKDHIWETLGSRRSLSLTNVHKMLAGQVSLNPLDYFKTNTKKSFRNGYSKKIALKFTRGCAFNYSFLSPVESIWNS